ncbi:MAG: HlyD family secretion protein [Planctomycetales bacterium]
MIRSAVLPLLAVALTGIAAYHLVRHARGPEPLNPPAAPSRAPFGETIAGSGVIEPWTENIVIGTHAAGVVEEVCVRVGQAVAAGEPLFRIDDRQLGAELAVWQAMLDLAESQLERLERQPRPEELPGSAARVREAEARFAEEEDRFQRSQALMERRIISEEDFALRRQALAVAREQLTRARADDELLRAGAWESDKAVARAAVAQARAEVDQARTELERLTVAAPVAGQVLFVNVRPGEYVAHPARDSLLILGHLEPLHVRIDIDEADIPRFQPGMAAQGYVRGDSEESIPLDFVRVEPFVVPKKSLTGGHLERVDTRVLQVIYAVRDSRKSLYVGQQIDVFLEVTRAPP